MPWQKGQSGNRNGRPKKGKTLTEALEKGIPKDLVVRKLKQLIEEGDVAAIKYYCDRIEGRPKETIEQHIETPEVIGYYPQSANTEDITAN